MIPLPVPVISRAIPRAEENFLQKTEVVRHLPVDRASSYQLLLREEMSLKDIILFKERCEAIPLNQWRVAPVLNRKESAFFFTLFKASEEMRDAI